MKNSASTSLRSFDFWSKSVRWKSSVSGASRADQKLNKLLFWSVVFSYSTQQYQTISHSDCDVLQKVYFKQWSATTSSVAGPRRISKVLLKVKLAPKQGHGHCLVVCYPSDPPQLSESQWHHYIWEVCSANQWDAPKTTTPAAGTGQQKGPDSPWQCLITHCTTSASEVELIGLWWWRLLIHCTHPSSHRPTTSSSSVSTFCTQNTSTANRREKMLSKSSLNPKACFFFFFCYRNKLISHWQKCVDCNGYYFD